MDILSLIETYGLDVILIALLSIFLVGCVKVVFRKSFEKMGKGGAKAVYETLSITFALALSALWILCRHYLGLPQETFTADLFMKRSSLVYASVKIMYPLYENYHLRDLVRMIGRLVLKLFAKKSNVKLPEDEEEQAEEQKTTIVL